MIEMEKVCVSQIPHPFDSFFGIEFDTARLLAGSPRLK